MTLFGNWRREALEYSRGENKPPDSTLRNAIAALTHAPEWQGVFGYDEMARRVCQLRAAPWDNALLTEPRWWTDVLSIRVAEWLQNESIVVSTRVAEEAVTLVGHNNPYHPVKEYLAGLTWDGTPRIDTWLTRYCGAHDTPFARVAGKKWLVSAVARIQQPGVKVDHMLVLEGEQGIAKSSVPDVLGGRWYTDGMPTLENKDAALVAASYWIIEIAEMRGLLKSTNDAANNFLTQREDRFRPPYGRSLVAFPRQCVFLGTVNPDGCGYLSDPTGGRRYWPIHCPERIRIDDLRRDRDQIWAEAMKAYMDGCTWWPDTEQMREQAKEEQAKRKTSEPWDERIQQILDCVGLATHAMSLPGPGITVNEIMNQMDIPMGQRSRREELRIASALRRLGYVRWKVAREYNGTTRYVRGFIHSADAGEGLEEEQ